MSVSAIALATHPANMDASAEVVLDTRINGRAALVFKVEQGFIPAYVGMTCNGYMPDVPAAAEWIDAYVGLSDAGVPV